MLAHCPRALTAALAAILIATEPGVGAPEPAPVALSELLSDPGRFDGRAVTIDGVIANSRGEVGPGGQRYLTFDLTDGKRAIRVFASDGPTCPDRPATVEGIFQQVRAQRYITATEVTCR